jgi:uncharacterized protein
MTDPSSESPVTATSFARDPVTRRWLASSAVVAIGMVIGGYLLGDGLTRARAADRSVTVRGLAERDVTADLATWTIAYSAVAADLNTAQASVDHDSQSIRSFFRGLGFPAEALQPSGVNVSQFTENGMPKVTVRQRMTLRTTDIARMQQAARRQFELVRQGVVLEEGSGVVYAFTRLNDIKPAMVAAATKDARAAAAQFAKDSGASVGSIKRASQGYFEITARDGEGGGGWGSADTPNKKVRVVTTVDFYLR